MKTRLHVDRLVLRTTGLSPAAAKAAARALAPALAEQLGRQAIAGGAIPALTVTVPAAVAASPAQLAHHVARKISQAPRT